jgi:hypothetical protein
MDTLPGCGVVTFTHFRSLHASAPRASSALQRFNIERCVGLMQRVRPVNRVGETRQTECSDVISDCFHCASCPSDTVDRLESHRGTYLLDKIPERLRNNSGKRLAPHSLRWPRPGARLAKQSADRSATRLGTAVDVAIEDQPAAAHNRAVAFE